MKITVLPCIHTDQAVAEIEDGTLPIEILSPRKLHKGEVELLVGRLYADVARFRFELDLFKHLAYLVPLWGLASSIALYYSLRTMLNIHVLYLGLYAWNMFWLMADGVWLTVQVALKGPQWWRARKAFKSLGEHWTAEVVVDEWLAEMEIELIKSGSIYREHDWVAMQAEDDEQFGHLYSRLLKRYPPRFMDMYPYGGGAGAHIANMIRGVPVRQSFYCYPVAKET